LDFAAVVVSGADKALSSPKRIFFVSREKARIRFQKGNKKICKNLDAKKNKVSKEE
tara:strand:+ start:5399 stop:5566 length:168 start_codon:yes stop_codon:yes gene_type:complete